MVGGGEGGVVGGFVEVGEGDRSGGGVLELLI